jgi:hypothetical protein
MSYGMALVCHQMLLRLNNIIPWMHMDEMDLFGTS